MITLVPIGGFLGAGKTTAMLAAARRLEATGRTVAIVTNDQGDDLVDTARGRAAAVPVGEVTGGCFCCRFDELVGVVGDLVRAHRADTVLAEAVGSCTDLAATVVRPLDRYHGDRIRVAPLTVLVDPFRYRQLGRAPRRSVWFPGRLADVVDPLRYLFRKQLEEAEVIALSKTDLLAEDERDGLRDHLARAFPAARVVALSSTTGQGLDRLVDCWQTGDPRQAGGRGARRALDLDYDLYAEAEARMAWLDAVLEIAASGDRLEPVAWVQGCLAALGEDLAPTGAVIGHVKVQLATEDGLTQGSVVGDRGEPVLTSRHETDARRGRILVNARAGVEPARLEAALAKATALANGRAHTETSILRVRSFRPARPRPVHRLIGAESS